MRKSAALKVEPALSPVLRSNLIGQVFKEVCPEHRLLVLDMGCPSSSTVKFFNQYKCRLSFLDLISAEFLSETPQGASHQELVEYFRVSLNIEPDMVADICLFWDIFNYLDGSSLSAFIEALAPHINHRSRGYCLGLLNERNQLPYCQYGIDSQTTLSQAVPLGQQPPVYPHNRRVLTQLLHYFEIDKSRLMPDGRVEYLLCENLLPRPIKPAIF